ncbi:MAG: DUF4279 domain-containing protein [Opitutae bacterium]|nr:DUF4279 domain-containing protein [Opitutae bacterium]
MSDLNRSAKDMPKSPKPKFWSGASLRIHDAPELHDEISARLGPPSASHKKGELRSPTSKRPWPNDIWMKDSPLPERRDIGEHLAWIAKFARPHSAYLRRLIRRGARIDIYLSYRCDHDHCGIGLAPEHLEIFTRLGIRMEVSILTDDL